MLSLLLDENIRPEVPRQIMAVRPDIAITGVHIWDRKRLLGTGDTELLREAAEVGFTLVTYDVNTIPPLLVRLANESFAHGGVVFISNASIRSNDIGGLVRALIRLYDDEKDAVWQCRLFNLERAAET